MKLSDVIGQERALSLLRSAIERARVHHAWLLAGPAGAGKEACARAFAASLLCKERDGTDACGACDDCRRVGRGVHPDLIELLPEAEAVARGRLAREDLSGAPSRELKIEQVRRLEARLALPPLSGERRAVLVLGADQMNVAAQNAFLKTLEEPPAGTILVLVADAADALLPTVRSRCARVPFVPLPRALLAAHVAKVRSLDPATADLVAALAQGSLRTALALDPAALAGRAELLRSVEALAPSDLRPVLKLAESLAAGGRDGAAAALAQLGTFYRDAAAAAEGAPDGELVHRDLPDLVHAAAVRGAPDALRRHGLAGRARVAIERHAQPRLALERLLLQCVLGEGVA